MWGVNMEGEGKQRKEVQGVIGDKVKGDAVPFTFPKQRNAGEEVRASALVYLECLEDHILQLLDDNKLLVCNAYTYVHMALFIL